MWLVGKKIYLKASFLEKDGPMAYINNLLAENPRIAQWAIKQYALAAIKKAKHYIYHGTGPSWPKLWISGKRLTSKIGKSTIRWNQDSRADMGARSRNKPLRDTGELMESIKILKSGGVSYNSAFITIGSRDKKAALHEYGGPNPLPNHKDIPKRPFLRPAMNYIRENSLLHSQIGNAVKKKCKEAVMKKSPNYSDLF